MSWRSAVMTAFVQGGLRNGDRIVPEGTHRVQPGQNVRIAQAE